MEFELLHTRLHACTINYPCLHVFKDTNFMVINILQVGLIKPLIKYHITAPVLDSKFMLVMLNYVNSL